MRRQIGYQGKATRVLLCGATLSLFGLPSFAACHLDVIGEGRAVEVLDATTFRLQDGQEVRLIGIIPTSGRNADRPMLERLVQHRDVILRGPTSKPDRYGRLLALVEMNDPPQSVQAMLLGEGEAVVSGNFPGNHPGGLGQDKYQDCLRDLLSQEATARRTKHGFWAEPTAIKNAEWPDDILPWIGQFIVAEGKITSVREAGGTIYVNFGRRWTRDFAVTISRRLVRGFEAAGIAPKTLENRVVRVRGWVEQRGGPRMEAFGPGQIELMDDKSK